MTVMKRNQKRIGLVFGLAVAASAGTAAADWRVARYPGQMCQIRDFEVADGFSTYIRADTFGRACNAHASHDIKVTCPVPKLDWKAAGANLEYGSGWTVSVTRDSTGTFDWDCTAFARDSEGDAYWYDDASPWGVLGAGNWWYDAMLMSVNRHHRHGYSHFQCVIPSGECLAGYTTTFPDGSCSGSGDC